MKLILILLSIHAASTAGGITGRIIGGAPAADGQFPYAAAIFKETDDGKYFYAGALISDRHVLTAAQAVYNARQLIVHVGSNRLNGSDKNREVAVTGNYIVHPDYNPITLENDIGLIIFRAAILENLYIKPIRYNSLSDLPPFVPVIAMGWGSTTDTKPEQSEYLQYTSVVALSNIECRKTYGNQIKDHMACVTGNNGEGTCYGDMGGPLVHIVGFEHKLVGIASFISFEGCQTDHPSGFTRVFHYEKWISEVTGLALSKQESK